MDTSFDEISALHAFKEDALSNKIEQLGATIRVLVRNLTGEILYGPCTVERREVFTNLRKVLLPARAHAKVLLFQNDGMELQSDTILADQDSLECLAIFVQTTLPAEEREDFLTKLSESSRYDVVDLFLSFPEVARDDHEIVLGAVKQNPLCMSFSSDACRDDHEFVLEAFLNEPSSFQYVGEACRNDRDIVLQALRALKESIPSHSLCKFCYKSDYRRFDILHYVLPSILRSLGNACTNDQDIILEAIRMNPNSLEFASEACRNDKSFVLKAVQENPRCLQHAGDICKDDRNIVFQAAKQKWLRKSRLSENRPIVHTVLQEPDCLQNASDACKEDRDFVLKVIDEKPDCLQLFKYLYMGSGTCRNHFEFVLVTRHRNMRRRVSWRRQWQGLPGRRTAERWAIEKDDEEEAEATFNERDMMKGRAQNQRRARLREKVKRLKKSEVQKRQMTARVRARAALPAHSRSRSTWQPKVRPRSHAFFFCSDLDLTVHGNVCAKAQ